MAHWLFDELRGGTGTASMPGDSRARVAAPLISRCCSPLFRHPLKHRAFKSSRDNPYACSVREEFSQDSGQTPAQRISLSRVNDFQPVSSRTSRAWTVPWHGPPCCGARRDSNRPRSNRFTLSSPRLPVSLTNCLGRTWSANGWSGCLQPTLSGCHWCCMDRRVLY